MANNPKSIKSRADALANLPNLGKVVSLKGDAATSATKQVARTVSPPRETDGGIFLSKRKFSISANASSEVTMNRVEYDGDLSKLNGELLAGWFIANPNGPTAFALGFVEYENSRRMFYKLSCCRFSGRNVKLIPHSVRTQPGRDTRPSSDVASGFDRFGGRYMVGGF